MVCKSAGVEIDRYVLGLSRLERDLGKALQFLGGTRDLRMILSHINFCYVCASTVPRVGQIEGDGIESIRIRASRSDQQIRISERRVNSGLVADIS